MKDVKGTLFVMMLAVALCTVCYVILLEMGVRFKITRKQTSAPVIGYARRIILECEDGQARLVQFALHENGTVTWREDQANPYRKMAREAQERKQREREEPEAQRQALDELKVELSATNTPGKDGPKQ